MPSTDDPLFIDGLSLSGAEIRRALTALMMANGSAGGGRAGVRPGDPGLLATLPSPFTTITVAAGVAALTQPAFGTYFASLPTAWTGTLTTPHATLDRKDLVYLRVWDNAVDGAGLSQCDVVYLAGTPSVTPVVPTPAGTLVYIPLANITVPHTGSGNPSVLDVRVPLVAPGGISPYASTPGLYAGQYRDTGVAAGTLQRYSGSAWQDLLPLAQGGQVNIGGSVSSAAYTAVLAGTGSFLLTGRVAGDSNNEYQVQGNGAQGWGPGTGAIDTTMSRTGAGQLTVGGSLFANNLSAATSFTPAITGGALTLGNGTITGQYVRVGGAYLVQFQISCGSTTTLASTGSLILSMPVTQNAAVGADGTAHFTKTSGGSNQLAGATVIAGAALMSFLIGSGTAFSAFNTTNGGAVATNSTISASILLVP